MKFFIMPLLIVFLLLLVLGNMSLSIESYELTPSAEVDTVAAPSQMKNTITVASIRNGKLLKGYELSSAENDDEEEKGRDTADVSVQLLKEVKPKTTAMGFVCTDNNSCQTLICVGGPIYDLRYEFDYILEWCENKPFDVIIENCTFNQNTISRSTFSGNFKMSTLTIRNCTLDTIVDNAFNYQTLNILTNLTFTGVQLKALNAQTFLGLESVHNFQLFNVLKQETLPFSASNFLQPMATSLSNLVLQQTEESCCSNTIYDPTEWLGGNSTTVCSKLTYVDLSGTNFNDTLNGDSFAKLSAVQELRLANCSLSTIAENVFTGIMSTLKSLDLRYNRLQTLDGELLAAAIPKGINMELGWNMWRCDCDNMETIEYMKQIKNNSAADTVCATPTELEGTEIRFAQLRCDETTTLTTITTTSTSTETTTTIAVEATTIKVSTTDYTTREPTGPISQATSTSSTNKITTSTLPISTADITSTTESSKTEKITDSTTIISADTTTTTSSSTSTSIMPATSGDGTEETTETNSETPSTSSTTTNQNSTLPTSSSATSITSTTLGDSTEVTTESNSKTSSTSSTTANDNSTFPTSSSDTSILPTTTNDETKETTELNSETQSTSSTTANQNSTLPTSSSDTSKMPTTSDSTIINTTQSNPGTPSRSSTTTNHNPILSTSSSATSIMQTTADKTEETTESNPKTSATTSSTTINQSTLSTSSSTTIMTLVTPDDSDEETTVSTSSAAASIHRW